MKMAVNLHSQKCASNIMQMEELPMSPIIHTCLHHAVLSP